MINANDITRLKKENMVNVNIEHIKIQEIISVIDDDNNEIKICKRCNGHGWYLSSLDFGDIPGDEREIICRYCNGTGRTILKKLEIMAHIPFNFNINNG